MKFAPLFFFVLLTSTVVLNAQDVTPRVIPKVQIASVTLNDAVKYLREAGSVNITLAPQLASLKTPDITLVNVTVEGALRLIASGMPEIEVRTVADSNGSHLFNIVPASVKPATKICRVFKASAKDKLQGPELEQLIQNLAEAAKKVCAANARAQGRQESDLPTIEAHSPTGILIVTGEESDVQLLGQVVQALGGEVIPLTDPKPTVLNLPNGGTGILNLANGANGFSVRVTPPIEQAQKQVEQAGKAAKQMEDALKHITIQVKPAEKK